MSKKFKKVVEWKERKWQKRSLYVGEIVSFLGGFGIGITVFTENKYIFITGMGLFLIGCLMICLKKRKVHWEEIK